MEVCHIGHDIVSECFQRHGTVHDSIHDKFEVLLIELYSRIDFDMFCTESLFVQIEIFLVFCHIACDGHHEYGWLNAAGHLGDTLGTDIIDQFIGGK